MAFMDKVKEQLDRAKEGVSDFAATTKLKHEISTLNDQKTALLTDIGRKMYELHGQGQVIPEVQSQFEQIKAIEEQVKHKAEEIAHITAGVA